jgi:Zn-dependent peptidase ImmA (M78 family)/DNA-binding transcriptional regulator YiaG
MSWRQKSYQRLAKRSARALAKAYINSEILRWAFARSKIATDVVAEKLGTSDARVASWVSGDELPTFAQAQKLAKALQVPFGYLYLPEPPTEQLPIAEFRRLPGLSNKIDGDTYDLLLDIAYKRDWYREYRIEEGFDELEFVGRFDADNSTSLIASDIRKELGRASNSLFSTRKTHERFLDEFIKAAERVGIWVMRSGVVANNTHRPIAVEALRGFAIADDIVPLIFLNGKDSKAAQVFTFAHEIAHLWIGKSSIEFGDLSEIVPNGDQRVERKCNSIAAELLVPSDEFSKAWIKGARIEEQATDLAERFSVSRVVIARRALEQSYIDEQQYRDFFASEAARWKAQASKAPGGGSYYSTIPSRNGKTFTSAVAREAAIGRLMYREAGQLLGVQPSKVKEIYRRGSD